MRGCILAGVWGAGKTTVYEQLLARLLETGCQSLVAMPQAATVTTHTYTSGTVDSKSAALIEWLRNLTAFLEDVEARFARSSLAAHRFASAWTPTSVLEGIGFDLPVYGLPHSERERREIEQRLADIGLSVVLLHVPGERVLEQCVRSTRRVRGERWARYLESFGPEDESRAQAIRERQEALVEQVARSPLPSRVIEVTGRGWAAVVDDVASIVLS